MIACLTPPGQGAIATLGLAGPAAWPAVKAFFRPRSKPLPDVPAAGQFWLGFCGTDIADEVILSVEGVERFSIHCHGGRAVVNLLLDLFTAHGLSLCSWQDFLRHTDPLHAEAAIALAHAATTRTAAILLDQWHGAFAKKLEAALAAEDAGTIIADLARWTPLGRHLTEPWRVTVAGPPNAGKSSIINALAGYQRSVVSATPGTTRDVVTVRLAIDGWPIELRDTAGLRSTAEALESSGIEQARRAAAEADLCLWIWDAAGEPIAPDVAAPLLSVINKTDLPAAWDLTRVDGVRVSALTGAGIAELCAEIARRLVPALPPPGSAVPFTPALCAAIDAIQREFAAGNNVGAKAMLAALRE